MHRAFASTVSQRYQFKNNSASGMCSGSEAGSCLRRIDSRITQLQDREYQRRRRGYCQGVKRPDVYVQEVAQSFNRGTWPTRNSPHTPDHRRALGIVPL